MSDQLSLRLDVIRTETLAKINEFCRFKVQLEEQLEENEVNLHYNRGFMDGLERAQKEMDEIAKGSKLEEMKQAAQQRRQSASEGAKNA